MFCTFFTLTLLVYFLVVLFYFPQNVMELEEKLNPMVRGQKVLLLVTIGGKDIS